jgi:hypothetical protein
VSHAPACPLARACGHVLQYTVRATPTHTHTPVPSPTCSVSDSSGSESMEVSLGEPAGGAVNGVAFSPAPGDTAPLVGALFVALHYLSYAAFASTIRHVTCPVSYLRKTCRHCPSTRQNMLALRDVSETV